MTEHTSRYMAAARAGGSLWVWSAGMTTWGRDPELWPSLLGLIRPGMRVWCLGAATGEEPLTLAARTPGSGDILATDVRDDAVTAGRAGRHPAGMVEVALERGDVTAGEVAALFPQHTPPSGAGGRWLVTDLAIRRRITWQRHDIVTDPLPPNVEVILCRNVLHTMGNETSRRAAVSKLAAAGASVIVGETDLKVPWAAEHWHEHFSASDAHPMILDPLNRRDP